jgi:16S rRNA (cytosine967-C5)-methyltransferase
VTPAARTQAAIELLDQVIAAAHGGGAAADTLIARYFATRRYAGSKDRRAVREHVYAAIRRAGEVPASGRAAMLAVAEVDAAVAATFDGSTHGPAPISKGERAAAGGVMPAWLADALAASGLTIDQQAALIDRAPLDVRVNRLHADAATLAQQLGGEPIPGLPDALRLPAGSSVELLRGQVEVQDAGSQIVSLAAQARAGQAIVDLCAGGGGKTLALAAAMTNEGRILSTDVDRTRLSRLMPRAARAGVTIVETRLLDPGREVEALADWTDVADCVLIDAPCSGTGGGCRLRGSASSWRSSAMSSTSARGWSGLAARWCMSCVRCSMPRGVIKFQASLRTMPDGQPHCSTCLPARRTVLGCGSIRLAMAPTAFLSHS